MMDPKVKQQWLDALRSGEYRQTRLRLRRNLTGNETIDADENLGVGFCCLGVLCDVVDPPGWSFDSMTPTHRGDGGYPGQAILNKIGLLRGDAERLAQLNDEKQLSFSEIADWIQENL